jgi:hypothetical protein
MRVRIHIDFEVSPLLKRIGRLALPVVIILVGGAVYAGVPNTFKPGDSLSAQTMNDNFTALDQRITKLEALSATETADGGWSSGATFCGSTGTTVGDLSTLSSTGTATGYAKARALCQAVCGAPGAHMCIAAEIVKSSALGHAVPKGWYSTGASDYYLNSDCIGWTSTAGYQGAVWDGTGPSFVSDCTSTNQVLCCD